MQNFHDWLLYNIASCCLILKTDIFIVYISSLFINIIIAVLLYQTYLQYCLVRKAFCQTIRHVPFLCRTESVSSRLFSGLLQTWPIEGEMAVKLIRITI
jgi:hypothetical protein